MNLFLKLILSANLLASFHLNFASEQISSSLELFDYQNTPIKLTILIATIEKRSELFTKLYQKLIAQLKTYGLETAVEILFYKDNQTITLGQKRNWLVHHAKGEYVCFLDDDDDICDDYLKLLFSACNSNPDCVSCTGIIFMPNKKPRIFVHSLKYKRIFIDSNGISCSPIYHINPVRKSIAIQVPFPEQNRKEDDIWSKQMMDRKLLNTEVEIKQPYYFYHFDPNKKI